MWEILHAVADWSVQFLRDYGYWAIFVLMLLETGMILHGVPSELIMTAAARLLAKSPGELVLVILVGTAGAAIGNLIPYWAALYGGRPFILRHPRIFHMTEARLDRMEVVFRRPTGAFLVFVCRLLPFLRAFVSIPAGLARMNFWVFFILSTLGALLFNSILAYGAYSGDEILATAAWYAQDHWIASSLLGLTIVAAVVLFARRRHVLRHHYSRHMPPGWAGSVIASLLAIALVTLLFFAVPTAFRAVVESLGYAGRLERTNRWVKPLLWVLGLVVLVFLLAAARHKAAALLSRWGKGGGRQPEAEGADAAPPKGDDGTMDKAP